MTRPMTLGALVTLVAVVAAAAGCSTTQGTPVAAKSVTGASTSTASAAPTTTAATTTTSAAPAPPAGPPISTATMRVGSGTGPVTIRYQINGGAEQTVTGATLPWEKQYPVYDKIQSSVTADGGDAEITCSIIMDGMLVAFKTEPRPTCSFAYYG